MKPFNQEEYIKNPSMKVVTRDGRNVKIHCVNLNNVQPVVAQIEDLGCSFTFYKDGKYIKDEESPYDLFFAPEKHEGWINIFRGKDSPFTGNIIFASKEEAEESGRHCCGFTKDLYITSGKVEWEE